MSQNKPGCLFGLFARGKPSPAPPAVPAPVAPLFIPYPEEPQNTLQTTQNTSVNAVLLSWLVRYNVPKRYYDFWTTQIDIQAYDYYPDTVLARFTTIAANTPAFTFQDTIRHLYCLMSWLNAGVIAHEQAHNSYFLLSDYEKSQFSFDYGLLKTTDPLIKLLYSKNAYGLTSDIEAHAELYRYLNDKMPESLKQYYPKLIGV